MVESKVKIAIIGATGEIGRQTIKALKYDERVSEIAMVVRRILLE